ncbi:MAG TPA: YceI family protein [Candidatus Dormibacteraeota bacterium]|nr:YceI family protein [Candidatus Dormibacteraeota bacterium]
MRRTCGAAVVSVRAVVAFIVTSAVFAVSPCALAQQSPAEVFTFNPSATRVAFTLAATLHTVEGTMNLKSGQIRFDPASGAASGEVIVDATSAETGNKSRDRRMHKEILQSARYPQIVFTAQRLIGTIQPLGTSQVQLSGIFELEGRQHPMTLSVNVAREAGNSSMHATAAFAVPYVQWGVKNPSTLFLRVSDHLNMTIDATGQLTPAR